MASVMQTRGVSSLSAPETVSLPNLPRYVSRTLPPCTYQIEEVKESECALVIFARHMHSAMPVVIKLLQAYQDTRYSLATQQERQQCQLAALEQNRRFTPEVYLGLAQIEVLDLQQGLLTLGQVMVHPEQETLAGEHEYALVMHRLPEESRLDVMLRKSPKRLQKPLQLLATRIAALHQDVLSPLSQDEHWGSSEQVREKLMHNFQLLDLILTTPRYHDAAESTLQDRLSDLREGLFAVFTLWAARGYFERRVSEQRIRCCHGDLKSPNIWVFPGKAGWRRQGWPEVLILDGADFNPSYTHIDMLSDIALLAVDIQARTNAFSPTLADRLTQSYLQLTDQCDTVSQAILRYYLVEKALVGAAVSLVYDDLPELGHAFLHVAEQRLGPVISARPGQSQPASPAAYTPALEPQ
jgi:aminoglycoside phosphotransferase family enzyme